MLKLSVVLATYNRADTLRRTLAHLADQDLDGDAYEVIVIDDASPDHTQAVVDEVRSTMPCALTSLRNSQNQGPGHTLNRGIENARAPIILFLADDIFLVREALGEHLKFHDEHREAELAAMGKVLPSPSLTETVFLRNWDPHRFDEVPGSSELPYWKFWACNISFKRDFMLEHGMLREDLGESPSWAAHEDAELGYRLHLAGLRIFYHAPPLGYHHHIQSLSGELNRAYRRGVDWSATLRHLIPEPELSVGYHVLSLETLGDHFRTLFGPRRKYLQGADRNALALFAKYFVFHATFNVITVGLFWRPLVTAAENSALLSKVVNRNVYRGIIFYNFTKGCRDGARMPPKFAVAAKAAG